jgi:hypothetical protein
LSTLKTAALFYIVFYIFNLISAVDNFPFENLNLSNLSRVFYPASFGKSGYFSPGLLNSLVVKAAALPKTTISNNELAPNLLAP